MIDKYFKLALQKNQIMSFDYNTSRKNLALPEYGRNIHKMVEYIKSIDDKEERNKLAQAVIAVMGNMNPHLRDINDFKHKLWDHLAIISGFDLDIDYPYEIPNIKSLAEKPRIVPYGTHDIKFKHYGKTIEFLIEAAVELPEGEEKNNLINIIANHMKKSYLTWNREVVSDEIILEDLKTLSKGKIDIKDMKLNEVRELIGKKRKYFSRKLK